MAVLVEAGACRGYEPSIRDRGALPILPGIKPRLRLPPPHQPLEPAPSGPDPAPQFVRHGVVLLAVDLAPEQRCTEVERLETLMLHPLNLLKLLI